MTITIDPALKPSEIQEMTKPKNGKGKGISKYILDRMRAEGKIKAVEVSEEGALKKRFMYSLSEVKKCFNL